MTRPGRLAPTLLLALLGLAHAAPVAAQPAADPASASSAGAFPGVDVSVELRDEYVQGVPFLVAIGLRNTTGKTAIVPDLAARPWLVRFDLVLPDGRSVRRATTPPESDSGRTASIPPAGQRRTLLEIPGAASTPVGPYRLDVQLLDGETPSLLASGSIRVAAPKPVGGDLGVEGLAGSNAGLQALWVHQAAQGYDIYLHQASTADPRAVEDQRFLLHVDKRVEPMLAASRAADARSPALAWAESKRTLRVVRVDTTGAVMADQRVELPWPEAEVVGRPALLTGGTVLLPLWVPAPSGNAGELRLVSIDSRGRPGFPRLASYASRPDLVRTTVSPEGAGLFLVGHRDGLDLYTQRAAAMQGPDALPVPGRRLQAAGDDGAIVHASFELLPDTDSVPGGLAVLVLQQKPTGLGGRWLDLQGNKRLTLPITDQLPAGQLAAVAPAGAGSPGLLFRSGNSGVYVEGPARQTVTGLGSAVSLVRDAQGTPVLRQLGTAQGPIGVTSLVPVAAER